MCLINCNSRSRCMGCRWGRDLGNIRSEHRYADTVLAGGSGFGLLQSS